MTPGLQRNVFAVIAVLAAASCCVTSGVAFAKPWAMWAPSPLASDSSFAALSALPVDSLDDAQYEWLDVQRDWRAQRDAENGEILPSSLTQLRAGPHRARGSDARFARLASQPWDALSDQQLLWLVSENKAQRRTTEHSEGGVFASLLLLTTAAAFALVVAAHPDAVTPVP